MTLEKEPLSLPSFIASAVKTAANLIKDADIKIDVQEGYDGQVKIDPRRFRRVLDNLLKNAVEAMPDGGDITIRTASEDGKAFIEVEDTGNGVPEEIRDKFFEAFVTAGKPYGTGLGTAIVNKIVEAHGGTITFETETGKGTKFIIGVPLSD